LRFRAGFRTFFEHVLQHLLVQRQIGDQPLELLVLVLEFFEPAQLGDAHSPVLLLPAVEGLLGDLKLTADLSYWGAGLSLSEGISDLFFGKSLALHLVLL